MKKIKQSFLLELIGTVFFNKRETKNSTCQTELPKCKLCIESAGGLTSLSLDTVLLLLFDSILKLLYDSILLLLFDFILLLPGYVFAAFKKLLKQ